MSTIADKYKIIVDALRAPRMPRKEIGVAQLALIIAPKLKMTNAAAYAYVRGAFQQMASAGFGKYVEGRRGHGSRFIAEHSLQDITIKPPPQAEPPLADYTNDQLWAELVRREKLPLDK